MPLFFSFFAIVIKAVHTDGKVWQVNEYFFLSNVNFSKLLIKVC